MCVHTTSGSGSIGGITVSAAAFHSVGLHFNERLENTNQIFTDNNSVVAWGWGWELGNGWDGAHTTF